MEAGSGKVIANFPIGAGVDLAGFDSNAMVAFSSCGEGTLNFFHEKSADTIVCAGAIKPQPSAKTLFFDVITGKIFRLAAEILETQASEPGKRPQRTIKPGSFAVLVAGKQSP